MLKVYIVVVVIDKCNTSLYSWYSHTSLGWDTDYIMIVHELIRRPVLVTYWLLNLIGAN